MKLFKNNSTKNTQLPITNPNNGPPNLNDINLPSTVEGELTNQTFPSPNINNNNNNNINNVDERDIMFNRNKADTSSQGLVGGPRVGKGHSHFQPSHIYRHPFFLGTFVMGVVSWMTAFIGQCVTEGELSEFRFDEHGSGVRRGVGDEVCVDGHDMGRVLREFFETIERKGRVFFN
jgi:hypothetical protein